MTIQDRLVLLVLVLVGLAACGAGEASSFPQPDQDYSHLGISDPEAATLLSLEQVDEYPLYTMHQYAEYDYQEFKGPSIQDSRRTVQGSGNVHDAWACTLFAALADPESSLFGRNFDWGFSPTVLLFTDPPEGYAAAAMVDIAYLGFAGDLSDNLMLKPIEELVGLLDAHHIPFDGLNEAGLAISMAAVAPGELSADPSKDTIGSLGIIRVVLDKAATVDEAIGLLGSYNIDFEGGPPLHYLVADARGEAVLVEFYQGEMEVIRSDTHWYQASNFLESAVGSADGQCRRRDTVAEELEADQGSLDFDGALDLLEQVAQVDTQWSVVYSVSSGEIYVVMGREFDRTHIFELEMLED